MRDERRCALITGAARRIGTHLAWTLAARGYALHLHTRSSDLAAMASELQERNGVSVSIHQVDLADTAHVHAWAGRLARDATPPTLIINNASTFPEPHSSTDLEHLIAGIRVHVLAAAALLTALPSTGGHVVNLLDARLDLLDGVRPGYELAKHTLATHTLIAAKELAPRVRVNAIAPGLVLPPPGADHETLERLAHRRAPLRAPACLDDVGAAVLFLENAASVTGQVIYVDSGEHLGPVISTHRAVPPCHT